MLNRDAFIEHYLDELAEHLSTVDAGILTLKKDPENEDALARLLRALHTIKGSSRMLKFNQMEKIVHGLENVFKGVKEKRYPISPSIIRLVFITTEYLHHGAAKIKTESRDALPAENLLAVFEKVYANEPYSLEHVGIEGGPSRPAGGPEMESGEPAVSDAAAGPASTSKPQIPPPDMAKPREAEFETVRIKISKTDKIIRNFNNLVIKQFQFKKENDALSELEMRFRELMGEKIGGGPGRRGKDPDYVRRENECLKLIRQIRKNVATHLTLLERTAFEVQEEIFSLRMLPIGLILGRLEKMAEDMAITLGKEITLSIEGGDVMIDKVILEKLHDPVIHLVRNAVDHGLEMPDDRERKGKPRCGTIRVNCAAEGGSITVTIADDGNGLDYEKIRKRAAALNPLQEEEILMMDKSALNTFLFSSGFSTSDKIQEFSGRGVGLDIVRHNIEKVKGNITLRSVRDGGSEFILALPLSLATIEGFFVGVGGEKFFVPANFVSEIVITDPADLLDFINRKGIKFHDRIVPVYHLAAVLDREQPKKTGDRLFVVVVESVGEMAGIVVDAVYRYASLIYKPPPKNLSRLRSIQGIVFDESYNIITILHIPELMKRLRRLRSIDSRERFSTERTEFKTVLVVDDSYSTREIEKSILELEGFHVETANDGIEALEKLRERHFHLVVTDIQMPRMDGLTFVENMKKDSRFHRIPVVVVSSLDAPDVQSDFMKRGAEAFIIKSDFDRGNLIQEVNRLVRRPDNERISA